MQKPIQADGEDVDSPGFPDPYAHPQQMHPSGGEREATLGSVSKWNNHKLTGEGEREGKGWA